jgi:hypothetical protein
MLHGPFYTGPGAVNAAKNVEIIGQGDENVQRSPSFKGGQSARHRWFNLT